MAIRDPSSPGNLLREWLDVEQISIIVLAEDIGVARATLSRVNNVRVSVSAEMNLRLKQALCTS